MFEYIKLGVVLSCIGIVLMSITFGYGEAQQLSASLASAVDPDGVAGPISFIWRMITLTIYAVGIAIACVLVAVVLSSLNLIAWSGEGIANRVGKFIRFVRSQWSPPVKVADEIIGRDDKQKPLSVKQVLSNMNQRIGYLESVTRDLEPPPEPKSAEEELAEMKALVESLKKAQSQPQAKA